MERVEVAEPCRGVHLRGDVAGLEAVDLVERDHDRDAELVDTGGDEAVAGPDPLACGEYEEDRLDLLERGVHRLLHPLGERVERPLEAGKVSQDELVVVAVVDSEDAPPGRLGLVRDDRDLAAAKRIHERRLADVRPPGHCHDPRLHSSSPIQGATRPHSVT
jgi:hypothetical protein